MADNTSASNSTARACGSASGVLSENFAQLHGVAWEQREPAVQLLVKLFQNVVNDPDNPKFRRLKLANATLQKKLFSVPGCMGILLAGGFDNNNGGELVLSDGVDVRKVVEDITAFGNKELMDHLRAERDLKIEAARKGEATVKVTMKTLEVSEEAKLEQQLAKDRQERIEKQRSKEQRQMLQNLAKEREKRSAKEKAASAEADDAPSAKDNMGQVSQYSNVKTMSDVMSSKQKKKKWVASKKKAKQGRGGKGMGGRATGRGGQTSGYREIPIPHGGVNLVRTESQELRAAMSAICAESRIDLTDLDTRRRMEGQERRRQESKALSTYKALRSRELARECQQQEEARRSAAYVPATEYVDEVLPHAVPADNSCLFHAVAYLMDLSGTITADTLRRLVADRMSGEPERWAEVAIAENRTVDAYTAWITNPSSWGGFVDLIVLSECFQTQISVVSLDGLAWTHYPDDANLYERRVYLLYNGVHYDAIVGTSGGNELRSFSPRDETSQAKVIALAAEMQAALTSQTLKVYECEECKAAFLNPAEAAAHCFDSGHACFREVDLGDFDNVEAGEDDLEEDADEDAEEEVAEAASDEDHNEQAKG